MAMVLANIKGATHVHVGVVAQPLGELPINPRELPINSGPCLLPVGGGRHWHIIFEPRMGGPMM